MSNENTATTEQAREKFAKAHGQGDALPQITKVGWGSGGHDVNDDPIEPDGTETIVPDEFLRKEIDGVSYPVSTTARFDLSLDKNEGIGESVSAVGLYDADGTLIAIKTFSPKDKDGETKIIISWDEEF